MVRMLVATLALVASAAAAETASPDPTFEDVNPPASVRDTAGALSRVRDGDVAFDAKHYEEALTAYQDAIALDAVATMAYLKLGLVYANLGRFQDAIDQWQQVLRLEPGNSYAPLYIAKTQSHLGASTTSPPAAPAAVGAPPPAVKPDPVLAAMNPPDIFGRDALICAPPGGCAVGESFDIVTLGHSSAGGGIGADARMDMTGFVRDESAFVLNADLAYWGFVSFATSRGGNLTTDAQTIARMEIGAGLGVPRFREHHLTPFIVLNGLSLNFVRGVGSDLAMYSPNIEVGIIGPRFGLSAAGGWAVFYGDGAFANLGSEPFEDFSTAGSAPYARVEGYFDVRLTHSMTLRAWASVEDIHQGLDESVQTPGRAVGSRDLLWGRAALLLKIGRFTVGPEVTFISPDKAPVALSPGASTYVGVLPETTVQLAFAYKR